MEKEWHIKYQQQRTRKGKNVFELQCSFLKEDKVEEIHKNKIGSIPEKKCSFSNYGERI